jgi:hypothetical protein
MSSLITPHGLSENYVVEVLGFQRGLLVEGRYNLQLQEAILREHLLFESWWEPAKKLLGKGFDKIKEKAMEPIEAIKEFGSDVKGIVAALTAAVQNGEILGQINTFATQSARSAGKLIALSIKRIGEKLEEYNMPTFAKGLYKIAKTIDSFRRKVAKISGWKGMLSNLAYILGIKYLDDEFGISEKLETAIEMLEEPAEYFKGEVLDYLTGEIEDAKEGALDAVKEKVVEVIKEKFGFVEEFKNKIQEFVQKLAGKAVEQFAGPIAWVKQAIELFGTAKFVTDAIAPILKAGKKGLTLKRESYKIRRSVLKKIIREEYKRKMGLNHGRLYTKKVY